MNTLEEFEANSNISLDTSTKSYGSFYANDDISIGDSVHSIISLETMRKKQRKNETNERMRELIKMKFKSSPEANGEGSHRSGKSKSQDQDNQSQATTTSQTNGIMTVRTLDESLHGGRVSEMRKLRRKVTIKIKTSGVNGGIGINSSLRTSSSGLSPVGVDDLSESATSESSSTSILDDISLTFSKVHIQEYEIVPGVNPSVSEGPPIELGWAHSEKLSVSLDKYEAVRQNQRRRQTQMRIPKSIRKDMLLSHGSTKKMIKEATKIAKKYRWW